MSRELSGVDDDLMAQAADRFERRLGEETSTLRGEISGVRIDVAQTRGDLRGEIGELRTEMREGFASVRGEMHEGFGSVRGEMHEGFASVRADMARDRFELLKWAFAFWIGQFFATAALLTALARR